MRIEVWVDVHSWLSPDGSFGYTLYSNFPPASGPLDKSKRYHGFVEVPDPFDRDGEDVDMELEMIEEGA